MLTRAQAEAVVGFYNAYQLSGEARFRTARERGELKRDVDTELQQRVHRDYAMVQEFRTAMLRLCQAALRTGQVTEAEHAAVLDWRRGDLRQISALKSALIFRRTDDFYFTLGGDGHCRLPTAYHP